LVLAVSDVAAKILSWGKSAVGSAMGLLW